MRRIYDRPLRGVPKRTEYNGVVYDSKAEADRAAVLDLLQRGGVIDGWEGQVPIDIGDPGVDLPFKVDFVVTIRGRVHAEDVCGIITRQKQRRIKQWKKRGPFPLHIIRGKIVEVIEGGKS